MKSQDKTFPFDDLLSEPLLEKLQKLIQNFESIQELLYQLSELDEMETLHQIQAGTALILLLLQKVLQGKNPKDFTREDWFEMSQHAMDAAENTEDAKYCVIVFQAYAVYIDASAAVLAGMLAKNKKFNHAANLGEEEQDVPLYARIPDYMPLKIHQLADEMRTRTREFESGEIKETAYIESCLWLALEAMFKLVTAAAVSTLDPRIQHFANGLSDYAFAYGRLMLYQKEQALLQSYLDHQKILDERLQQEYDDFMQDLNAQAQQFSMLVDNAFSPSFRQQLHASAAFALAAGVSDNEILKSAEDVDDFFLN